MSNSNSVQVLITRACYVGGQQVDAGELVAASPEDAMGLVGSTRGRLVDSQDWELIKKHNDAANARINQSSRSSWRPSRF